jgi:hypothetical protein
MADPTGFCSGTRDNNASDLTKLSSCDNLGCAPTKESEFGTNNLVIKTSPSQPHGCVRPGVKCGVSFPPASRGVRSLPPGEHSGQINASGDVNCRSVSLNDVEPSNRWQRCKKLRACWLRTLPPHTTMSNWKIIVQRGQPCLRVT